MRPQICVCVCVRVVVNVVASSDEVRVDFYSPESLDETHGSPTEFPLSES